MLLIVENLRKIPPGVKISWFSTRFPYIYGSIRYEYGSTSIKNSMESILISALAIATANNKCLVVKTGDPKHDFQKSATCLDTVRNSSFKIQK